MAGIQTSQGIGSGEAQVIGTPLTNQAMFNATRIAEARRAKQAEAEARQRELQQKQEEDLAKDMLKADLTKTWVKDQPRLLKKYQDELVGTFQEYRNARTDEERNAARLKLAEAKLNLEMDVSESRAKNDDFKKTSEVILGLSPDERDETFLQQFSAIKEKDSRDWDLDPTAAVKLPKDVDLLKMREDVADASLMAKQPTTDIVEIDGVRLVRNTKGQIIDPVAFGENIKIKSMSSRPYAKFLKTQYFDEWTKSGGDAGDLEGFLEFAGNKEYDIYRKTKDKTEVTTSQVGTQPTYNFGSNTTIPISGLNRQKTKEDVYEVQTEKGGKVRRVSPSIDVVPIGTETADISSNGYFDSSGNFVSDNKIVSNGEIISFVTKPVIYRNGKPMLWSEKTAGIGTNGEILNVIGPDDNSGVEVVKFAEFLPKGKKKAILVPLSDIPAVVLNKKSIRTIADNFYKTEGGTSLKRGADPKVTPIKATTKINTAGTVR